MSRKMRRKAKKELKNFWSVSFAAAVVLLAGAILQLNGYIHQNSLLTDSKKQIVEIAAENDAYEEQLSQSNSLANFNEYAAAQSGNYEKVDVANVHYVHALGSQLAKK